MTDSEFDPFDWIDRELLSLLNEDSPDNHRRRRELRSLRDYLALLEEIAAAAEEARAAGMVQSGRLFIALGRHGPAGPPFPGARS